MVYTTTKNDQYGRYMYLHPFHSDSFQALSRIKKIILLNFLYLASHLAIKKKKYICEIV